MLSILAFNTKSPITHAAYRSNLKKKILISQKQMREKIKLNNATIIHRTAARNIKSPHTTVNDEQMDALYATQSVMGIVHKNKWEYVIHLPKNKLTGFAKTVNKKRKEK